jgi:hypothetical protein
MPTPAFRWSRIHVAYDLALNRRVGPSADDGGKCGFSPRGRFLASAREVLFISVIDVGLSTATETPRFLLEMRRGVSPRNVRPPGMAVAAAVKPSATGADVSKSVQSRWGGEPMALLNTLLRVPARVGVALWAECVDGVECLEAETRHVW